MKKTAKLLALLLALALCLSLLPASAMAAETKSAVLGSGKCGDNVTWKLTDDGVLTISGTGDMTDYNPPFEDYNPPYVPWADFYSGEECTAVKTVVVEDGVTSIGYNAFRSFTKLTKVTLADSVTAIMNGAFENCTSLKSIAIPDSVTRIEYSSFAKCRSLSALKLPNNLKYIGGEAFLRCKALKNVTIPEGVETIGEQAFQNCSALETVEILPGLKKVPASMFYKCTSLKSIKLPAITSFVRNAVNGCTALTDIYYPGSQNTWQSILTGGETADLDHATIHAYYHYNDLRNCTAKLQYSSYGYTGKAIKPKVAEVRTCSGTKLTQGTHYTVSYENNVNYGTGTAILTGIGKYHGTVRVDFAIVPAKIKGLTMTGKIINSSKYFNVSVSWTKSPQATKYYVYKSKSKVAETTGTDYTYKGLGYGYYTLGVRAVVTVTDPETGEETTYIGNRANIKIDTMED